MKKKIIISLVSAIVLISALQLGNIQAKTITENESYAKGEYGPFPCGIWRALVQWTERLNAKQPNNPISYYFNLILVLVDFFLMVLVTNIGFGLGVNVFEDCQLCASG